MKKILIAAAMAAVAMAPVAHADEDDFLDHAHMAHLHSEGGDDELVALGHSVCKELGKGVDYKEISEGLIAGGDMKSFQSGELIAVAAHDLCPAYWDSVSREAHRDYNQ